MSLYDPQEFPSETDAPAISVEVVLAWARTKDPDERYNYQCDYCVIGQFIRAAGIASNPEMGSTAFYADRHNYGFDKRLDTAASEKPWTFGGFAERLARLA